MTWFLMGAAGSSRDLWVSITGADAPAYGRWITSDGVDVVKALETGGPPDVRVRWHFQQPPEHRGTRLVDAVWQYGRGIKVYSDALCEVLRDNGGDFAAWPADVRLKDGSPVPGYQAVLEQVATDGPLHSLWRGRRADQVVVSAALRKAIMRAGCTGVTFEEVPSAFPGDNGYFDDDD